MKTARAKNRFLSKKGKGGRQRRVNSAILSTDLLRMGSRTGESYLSDPKHLVFNLARYKFVAKMFVGLDHVVEIGCGDGFGTALVADTVGKLTASDLDARFIEETKALHPYSHKINFLAHDMIKGTLKSRFDGLFSLDVLEHIPKRDEGKFLRNVVKCLTANGICIIGMPSLESQVYASKLSKRGHVNCKTGPELKALMEMFFHRVFVFSMNDEVLHTGFYPMAHYLLALCVFPRRIES
jgi:protein-L-isoaspartate O-methyltransferase